MTEARFKTPGLRVIAIVCLLFCVNGARAEHYLTGGPALPAFLQEGLDKNRDLIRLGINTETLEQAGIAPVPFVKAILQTADCVRSGHLAGAVVYLNTLEGDNLPIGIGNRIVEPEVYPAEWQTIYEAGELTGMLAVMPFLLQALEHDKLRLDDTLGHFFPEFHGSDKESITLEMLLRHSSGLPELKTVPKDENREGILETLARGPLVFEPGSRSRKSTSNLLVLGLIMSKLCNAPVQEHALKELHFPLGMVNTSADLPATWREQTAPGPFSTWHDRLVWGEAEDPTASLLGSSAGHGGMFTTCDDLGLLSKGYLSLSHGMVPDLCTTPTLQLALKPAPMLRGGAKMGLGLELNQFGEGSYGWNSPNGCSLWINPRANAYLVILSNRNHPLPRKRGSHDCRSRTIAMLRKAVRALGPDV